MKEICPTDENGKPTYAASLWPDWDGDMVMYVKSTATAYYGYDELGIGLYDPNTGNYYDCLAEDGPYLRCLKFYNTLYQNGLLDPDSMTQTYDEMSPKVQAGGTFFSIFNYSGYMLYNTDEHLAEGKMMRSLTPNNASPIVYGMDVLGGNRLWCIGAKTEYPELCMEIINYLCTPEGRMTMEYAGIMMRKATPTSLSSVQSARLTRRPPWQRQDTRELSTMECFRSTT
jgi:multiple sugar transport system substrate-binding protein/putative aldouronate transport system substrate-binding protein